MGMQMVKQPDLSPGAGERNRHRELIDVLKTATRVIAFASGLNFGAIITLAWVVAAK